MKTKILLDTNFILYCIEQKIDIFESIKKLFYLYDIIILKQVIDELRDVSEDDKESVADRQAAFVALEILKNKNGNIKFPNLEESGEKNADKSIVNFAKENKNVVVATMDKELRENLQEKAPEAKILAIRQKSKLEIL